ncbi:MAG: 3-phosphoshikimate 1-carboxyvinyltransferase, partial [Daejeonella sp.]
MSLISISAGSKHIHQTIQLTGSKSESNRALILRALSKGKVTITNLSAAADTVTLEQILTTKFSEKNSQINVGPAGTAMRFLTAYAAVQDNEIELSGS